MRKLPLVALCLLGTALLPLSLARAADITWTGAGDRQTWTSGANWDSGTVPGTLDVVYINTSNNSPVMTSSVSSIVRVEIGSTENSSGLLTITGANTALTTASSVTLSRLNGATSVLNITNGGALNVNGHLFMTWNDMNTEATVNVSGENSYLGVTGQLQLGRNGNATLNVTDGAGVKADQAVFIGSTTPTTKLGILNLSGEDSYFTAMATLTVRNAEVHVRDGAHLDVRGNATFGHAIDQSSVLRIDGENTRATIGGQWIIANRGDTNAQVTNNSLVTVQNDVFIGTYANTVGELLVSSGANIELNSYMTLAYAADSIGILTVTGAGTSLISENSQIVGLQGNGSVTLTDGALMHSKTDIHIGYNANSEGLLVLFGNATLAADNILHIGTDAGASGTLVIGGEVGSPAATAGQVNTPRVIFGAGSGSIVFNHNASNYVFSADIEGAGHLNFMAGTTYLTGDNSLYVGNITISPHARLHMNGILSATETIVEDSAWLTGTGTMGDVVLLSGGTLAPGNSIGTIHTASTVFHPDSVYQVEVNAAGQNDQMIASGVVTINGGRVVVIPYPDYKLNHNYTIISAAGGVINQFDTVETAAPFLTPLLSKDANNVYLTLSLGSTPESLAQVGNTFNRNSMLNAMQAMPSSSAEFQTLVMSPNVAAARASLDSMSGEIHPGIANNLIGQQASIRQTPFDRAGRAQMSFAKDGATLWMRATGTRQTADDNNTARLRTYAANTMVGIEKNPDVAAIDKIGFAVGHTASWFNASENRGSADAQSLHALAYAERNIAEMLYLRGGVSYSWHDVDTRRNVNAGSLQGKNKATYDASTVQVFAETGYEAKLNQNTILEPSMELAYVVHQSDSFTESGDAAVLQGDKSTRNLGAMTARLTFKRDLGQVTENGHMTALGGLGYRYQVGDVNASSTHSFKDTPGYDFAVKGAPLARHALILNTGVAYQYNRHVTTHLAYEGAFAEQNDAHSLVARFKVAF